MSRYNDYPYKVYFKGNLAGEHKTKSGAEKRVSRLMSMGRGKTTSSMVEIKYEPSVKKNPVHTAKFDRCVREVQAKGVSRNAFAVCTVALDKAGFLKKNPVRDPEHKALLSKLAKHFSTDEEDLRRIKNPRRGPWPKGRTPPHLRKYLFR